MSATLTIPSRRPYIDMHMPVQDEYDDVSKPRGTPVQEAPMVTVYWGRNRPTPTLQFNLRAKEQLLDRAVSSDGQPVGDIGLEVAVLISRADPTRVAFEPRPGGLKMTRQRVVSGGALSYLVDQDACPIRLTLSPDPERPGRLLTRLPQLPTIIPGRAPAGPPMPPAPTFTTVPSTIEAAGQFSPPPPERSAIMDTIAMANQMQPPDLTPAPSPEDLDMDDSISAGGDDQGDDDDDSDDEGE